MKNRNLAVLSLAVIFVFACNLPAAIPAVNPIDAATSTPLSGAEIPTATATTSGSTVPFASPSGGPLNCRSGPDTSWPIITVLSTGQSVEIVGKNPGGTWLQVKAAGTFCWISAGFATITGDLSAIPIVAVPPTPTTKPGSSSPGVISSVDISVKPDSISVPGCIGPIQPVTIYAKIQSNGAIKIDWHFKDEQSGNLSSHSLNFKKADIQDVSDSFTPKLNAGKWKVSLIIDGVDLKGLHASTFYTVSC